MKTGAHNFVAGLLFCLCATCHADGEATFSYRIHPEARLANSERVASYTFPDQGCLEAISFLLPATFGDAGMHEFVHADVTQPHCAFRTENPGTSGVSFSDTDEIQRASEITPTQKEGVLEYALATSSAGADPSSPEANPETESVPAAPKPTQPMSGMPTPDRASRALPGSRSHSVNKGAGSANKTMSPARYRWVLYVSVLLLALALLALFGALSMLLYLRWCSERALLARAVNRGLRRKEFYLEYQPVFYTGTRKCIGLEVALRWTNVTYGLRGEAWYMDKLADRRSARKIVTFVLSTADKELGRFADDRKLYLMINLWKTCLKNEDCLSLITAKAKSFASGRLVFQVKADDLSEQLGNVARLRENRVRIAVSGVRTGTLITASALPVDLEFIKVDRNVMGLDESDRLRTLRAIAAAGLQLDVAVIADGVEGSSQYAAIGRAQIDLAQGFFLGKAVPATQIPALFEKLDWWQGKHFLTASAASPA